MRWVCVGFALGLKSVFTVGVFDNALGSRWNRFGSALGLNKCF